MDDGELSSNTVRAAAEMVSSSNGVLRYFRTQPPGGLIQARLIAIEHAAFDIVTFLDDDVEIKEGYFERLPEAFKDREDIVGVGGVDLNTKPAPLFIRAWQWFFFIRSMNPGRLSITGFNRSMDEWVGQQRPFESEFLSGCNMSFRLSALEGIVAPPFLHGYSLGEDLYLCWWARRCGRLVVDPRMTVRHWSASLSRPDESNLWNQTVVNHWHLLQLRGCSPLRAAAFFWSVAGLFGQLLTATCVKQLLQDHVGAQRNLRSLAGLFRGVSSVLRWQERESLRGAQPRH